MKVALSWVRDFVPLPLSTPTSEVVERLVGLGFEVEGVKDLREELSGPLQVAEVLEIEEITGQKKPIRYVKVAASDQRYVICGATNFEVGDFVVLALPGSVLPGDFAIAARETYGKISNGMICSARELGMGEDHSGIIVLDPAEPEVRRGADAISLLKLDDVILDVSVNPDRGYAMSIRGIAREIALAFDLPFTDPVSLAPNLPLTESSDTTVPQIEAGADYIVLRTIEDVDVSRPTPLQMVRRLQMAGMRSISLAVDITNYIMLEYGQPLHAFDRAKITGTLKVRRAGKSATLTTLDGQEHKLNENDLLIADENGALALAGTMGGLHSEVTPATNSITIEAAHFFPMDIARNARAHKLSTEASRRFERGVDAHLPLAASAQAIALLSQLGGGRYVGGGSDGAPAPLLPISMAANFPATLVGSDYSVAEVKVALEKIGAMVESTAGSAEIWQVSPPSWRPDLTMAADLVEEVARIVGYEQIPSILPPAPLSRGLTAEQRRRRRIAQYLADRGLLEVQNYPFVSPETIEVMGFQGARARTFKIANPISEQEPLLRPHLIPGLIDAAVRNLGRGAKSMALFEMGSIFRAPELLPTAPPLGVDRRPDESEIRALYESVPNQLFCVGAILVGDAESESWRGKGRKYQWHDAVALAQEVIESTGNSVTLHQSDFAPWHTGRCAELRVDGKALSHAGELHPRVIAHYGLPARTCAMMVILDFVPIQEQVRVRPLSTMVPTIQDIALVVPEAIALAELIGALRNGAGELLERIELFDRYTGKPLAEDEVSYAFTLTFRAADRTLTAEEVAGFREGAVASAAALGARLRG
ncbi:MAG: phenylalanine--tRNA ligase subunit beta [Actinobacteria bacterium]|nr:phenylalanine--tRNA ligase subunit beta [Actinomycetota bacterium]